MAVFPQLATGATAQFRFEKQVDGRAILNRAMDASTYAAADPAGRRVKWGLEFVGLTESEFGALEGLFEACEGRLGAFTFLDPAANLLGWTEDLGAAAWDKDALLSVAAGSAGPAGEGFLLTNAAPGWGELWQTVEGPANFSYSFAVWVRGSGMVRLRRFAGAESAELEFALTASWRRVELNGALAGSGVSVSFAIGVPSGGMVEAAGPQVDAQLVAGEYRKSLGRGGVFQAARFAQDTLEARVEAPDWIDARVTIESRFED